MAHPYFKWAAKNGDHYVVTCQVNIQAQSFNMTIVNSNQTVLGSKPAFAWSVTLTGPLLKKVI